MLKAPVDPGVGAEEFREALRRFASGVTVITTTDAAGKIHGMTATAFSSLSLDPPLVLVAIAKGTRCHRHVTASRRFGVSVLAADQVDVSRQFGGRPKLGHEPAFKLLHGVAVLDRSLVQLACDLDEVLDGGDHSIFTGRVTATRTIDGDPLIHFGGRYRGLSKDVG